MEEESDQPEMEQQSNEEGGEGPSKRRRGEDARITRGGQERQAAEGEMEDGDEGEDRRQYPESPKPRRTNPDAQGYGGWDAIDSMTVD